MYFDKKVIITDKYCNNFQEFIQLVKIYLKQFKHHKGYNVYIDRNKKALVIEGRDNYRLF